MWPLVSTRDRRLAAGPGAFLLAAAVLGSVAGCGGESTAPSADQDAGSSASPGAAAPGAVADAGGSSAAAAAVSALGPLLARTAGTATVGGADRQALEQAMQEVVGPAAAACEGCSAVVSYVDQAGGADYFRCALRDASRQAVADLEIYHRAALATDAASGWARATIGGHPSTELSDERLFVWPGRFEIRAFRRGDGLRGERPLEALLESLPLDALAKL
jgi:hypothetical protein